MHHQNEGSGTAVPIFPAGATQLKSSRAQAYEKSGFANMCRSHTAQEPKLLRKWGLPICAGATQL
eukprot:1150444-Pelagomonas_calceolata.AAC.3